MIKLYEVKVPVDGYTMSILMASPDARMAIGEVAKQLRASVGCRENYYNWQMDEMTATEVEIRELRS